MLSKYKPIAAFTVPEPPPDTPFVAYSWNSGSFAIRVTKEFAVVLVANSVEPRTCPFTSRVEPGELVPIPTLPDALSNTNEEDPFATPLSLKTICVFDPAIGPVDPVNPVGPVAPAEPVNPIGP